MCALYKLIALVALALSCRAQLTPEECQPLTKTLSAADMHKIYGHWTLAAAFADFDAGFEMIANISTSHLDLSLNNDKNTIHYNEMNKDLNGVCVSRSSDATVVNGVSTALTLHLGEFVKEQGGVQSKYNADADVVFYQTCPNCLVRIYKATYSGQEARVLFFYRRNGRHIMEVEKLSTYEESMKKQAKCLKFQTDLHYMHDGKPETTSCKAQLTPEQCAPLTKTLPASETHRIFGHWVLAGAFADFQAGLEMIGKISTSYLDLSLSLTNDKATIHYHEMNKDLNGKCVSRSSEATVVNGENSAALTLRVGEFVKEEDGVQSQETADADVVFYQTCPNCLVRVYKGTYSGQEARVLFFYRREGKHLEVEKLTAYEQSMRKQAECLKFLPDSNYMYDGKPVTTSCKAEFTPEQCEPLTKPLPASDSEKYKIYGNWVLAAAFADFQAGLEMIGNIATSHLDLSLNNDKNTIFYSEMNRDLNGKCVSRSSEATIVNGESTALTLRVGEFVKEEDGVLSKYTADADVVFYQTCPNCLVRIYKATYSGQEARVLFFYRREGKHLEVEKLTASAENMKKRAKCLKFFVDPHYMYDGKAETPNCRAQLTPEQCALLTKTLPASETHRIYGQWVLAGAFADFQAGLEMIGKISTSYLDLSLNNDKNTVQYHEMNKDLNGKCVSRSSEATVVSGESTAALTLRVGEFAKEEDGVESKYTADADVVFYQTCPNCLVRIYKASYSGQEARILFFYRREGKHLELEKLTAYEESMRKQAECLKFLPDSNYMYDGKPVTTSCKAEFTPEQCEPLTKPLPASEKYKIYGRWVLAGAFADFAAGLEMIGKISTSRLDLSLNNDKNTIHYNEMNRDLNGKCVSRSSEATVVDRGSTALTLRVGEFVKEEDGVQSKYTADADVVFYQTCPNCLVRIYKATYSGQQAQVLFFYRREGEHLEVEKLIASGENIKKQAKCLKFLVDPHYHGRRETTSCRAQLTPEQCAPLTKTLPASETHTIYGQWVLAGAFADFQAGLKMIGKISTSYLDLSLNTDKNTVQYHEMNKDLSGKCVSRSSEATIVNGESTAVTLRVGEFVKEEDGVQSQETADADVVFYQTCPNCLVRIYKATYSGQEARVLFFYRREGKHLEVEKLIAYQESMKKQAECLKFLPHSNYMYDGKPVTTSCKAEFTTEQCEPLTKPLPASEKYKIYGHWVLAAAFADFQAGLEMIGKISTSHLDLSLNNDKNTIHYNEMNKDLNGKCVSRSSEATVVNGESTALTLRVGEFAKEEDGVESMFTADADVVFYQTCPHCLVRIYKGTYSGQEARVLFFYRREGKHLEAEKLIASEENIKKQAKCLKFLPVPHYMYDGKPETTSCRAQLTPEQCEPLTKTLPASEMQKIYGNWVLAAAFVDFEAGFEMIAKISTSRLDLSLNDDKSTIRYHEMNKDLHNVCVGRSSDATVVNGETTACTLHVGEFIKVQDAVESKYTADADVVFYQTCPNCLVRIYKGSHSGQEARVLFFYRREGEHLEVEKLLASAEYMKKQARCLKFFDDPHYMYDGKPEVCKQKA